MCLCSPVILFHVTLILPLYLYRVNLSASFTAYPSFRKTTIASALYRGCTLSRIRLLCNNSTTYIRTTHHVSEARSQNDERLDIYSLVFSGASHNAGGVTRRHSGQAMIPRLDRRYS